MAVLRTGAKFDRPHPDQTAHEPPNTKTGGFSIATTNLYRAAWPLVSQIVAHGAQ